jgi:hypothetical protein
MLEWVIVGGARLHVGTWAFLPPARRPVCFCPVCDAPVILKLGSERAHHAAHKPGATCPATQPETAAHLNTKFHLAEALRAGGPLLVKEGCIAREPGERESCAQTTATEWSIQWDGVEVERSIGGLRPDILLLKGSMPVGAIEVLHTHAVTAEKAAALKDLGLPWIEVRADTSIYAGSPPWIPATPLPVVRRDPAGTWVCDSHRMRALQLQSEAARDEREEAQRKAFEERITYFRVVDVFYASGKKWRALYYMVEKMWEGRLSAASLRELGNGRPIAYLQNPPIGQVNALLSEAFEKELLRRARFGAIVDSPLRWCANRGRSLDVQGSLLFGDSCYPRRYYFDNKQRRWVRQSSFDDDDWN